MQSSDERALIERAKSDPAAFRALYTAWVGRVYAYIAYRVANRADAEDLTADVFTQVVRAIGRFDYRGDGAFAAWLFRIAHNAVIAHAKRAPRPPVALDDLPDLAGDSPLPEQSIAEQERFARLYAAIARLSPRRQEIVRLRYFGELRNQEIASVLGLDERTIASHLTRAIADLQRFLSDEIEREAQP